jgi:hypothetical protein
LLVIQKIVNQTTDKMEEFSFAKLLLMFIHYDLGNDELLEYQVRSYNRLMQKTDRVYKCEQVMVAFFKSVSTVSTKNKRLDEVKEVQKKIAAAFKTHYERGFSFYFDIHAWIASRLGRKDFAEVVREMNE